MTAGSHSTRRGRTSEPSRPAMPLIGSLPHGHSCFIGCAGMATNAERGRKFRERNPNAFREWVAGNRERKRQGNAQSRRRSRERFYAWKSTLACSQCGESHPAAIDFHHRNPEGKSFEIAKYVESSWEKLMEEAGKCEVLCSNCHRIAHTRERVYYGKERRFQEYKATLSCVRCGEARTATLQFHHRVPSEKLFSISPGYRQVTWEELMREIAKCDVLCANCHNKEHWRSRQREEHSTKVGPLYT